MADPLIALLASGARTPTRRFPPLAVRLGHRRWHLGITQHALARALGVTQPAVYKWDHGYTSPRLHSATAYAHHVDWRLVLHDGQHILAEGEDVPGALPGLRRAAGLRQGDLAAILCVSRSAVAMWETRGMTELACVETYASGLGLEVGVADLGGALVLDAAARRWAA